MKYIASYNTNKGIQKETNQDSFLLKIAGVPSGQIVFMALCDGMGGLNKGELASKEVIEAFDMWFHEEFPQLMKEGFSKKKLEEQWNELLDHMNSVLLQYGEEHGCHIGTTLTAMLFIGEEYYIMHVGDSRVYEMSEQMVQLTRDHTLVQREVDSGVLTKEQACRDKRKNILLQSVGAGGIVVPDFFEGKIKVDAVYLLCSDGFRNKIKERELYAQLNPKFATDADEIKQTLQQLICLAMERKEQDNITAIAVRTF